MTTNLYGILTEVGTMFLLEYCVNSKDVVVEFSEVRGGFHSSLVLMVRQRAVTCGDMDVHGCSPECDTQSVWLPKIVSGDEPAKNESQRKRTSAQEKTYSGMHTNATGLDCIRSTQTIGRIVECWSNIRK